MDALPTNEFEVVCLQRNPQYFEETITLLNNQWPRSRTARMRSLEQGSSDSLPTSLILLQDLNGKKFVVAHSKISPVPYKPQLCFVESVVVEPRLRGKGVGRLIMQNTEEYVKSLGITIVYLTTFDQQGFYSKLGYELCDPIVVFGGSLKLTEKVDNCKMLTFTHPSKNNESQSSPNFSESSQKLPKASTKETPADTPIIAESTTNKGTGPPPPPLPPPLITCNNNVVQASKVTMRKVLCN